MSASATTQQDHGSLSKRNSPPYPQGKQRPCGKEALSLDSVVSATYSRRSRT